MLLVKNDNCDNNYNNHDGVVIIKKQQHQNDNKRG